MTIQFGILPNSNNGKLPGPNRIDINILINTQKQNELVSDVSLCGRVTFF